MTEPTEFDLLELATPYALNAVSDDERTAIERQLATASVAVSRAFDDEVRAIRETMAVVSAATAADPPAHLRAAVLATARSRTVPRSRWRTALLAAAAAVIVGLAAFGAGIALRHPAQPSMTEQIMAARDVRTVSRPLDGGTATVVFSRAKNAGVLVMNNVPPPSRGTVYQMWLLSDNRPQSAGTMDTAAVAPSTTAMLPNIGSSSALAFTVEPGKGSPQPTGKIFAELPLT